MLCVASSENRRYKRMETIPLFKPSETMFPSNSEWFVARTEGVLLKGVRDTHFRRQVVLLVEGTRRYCPLHCKVVSEPTRRYKFTESPVLQPASRQRTPLTLHPSPQPKPLPALGPYDACLDGGSTFLP